MCSWPVEKWHWFRRYSRQSFEIHFSHHFSYISQFINSCFIHNHFPQDMLSGVIKPSIKDKSGNIKCSNNCREVVISTNFFKIVEYMMIPFIKKIILVLISSLIEVIALPFLPMLFYEKF